MKIDKFIRVSFALALLFVLPALPCIFFWPPGVAIFGGIALFFGACEIGAIALAFLMD